MKYGLLGASLSHSFSKVIHSRYLGHPYELYCIVDTELEAFLKKKDFIGFNVTIPYKTTCMKYLDEIDPLAQKIGAVNTIVNKNNKLYGYNSDYDGFLYTIQKHNIDLNHRHILVLGYGGAAKAVSLALQNYSYASIHFITRTSHNQTISLEEAYKKLTHTHIIINATNCGMSPYLEQIPIDLKYFHNLEGVIDLIYNPLTTLLCQQAKKMHIPYVNGLEMLVAQAIVSATYFYHQQYQDYIHKYYLNLYFEQCNFVFIGMPGCGKSTLAKAIAPILSHSYIDIDHMIEEDQKQSIASIFKNKKESYFRSLEKEKIHSYKDAHGLCIACGGGVVEDQENIQLLSYNGIFIYIQKEIQTLPIDKTRPLSSSFNAIQTIYERRKSIYETTADITINNNGTIEELIQNCICEITKYFLQLNTYQ